jgi:hypothetical protein
LTCKDNWPALAGRKAKRGCSTVVCSPPEGEKPPKREDDIGHTSLGG